MLILETQNLKKYYGDRLVVSADCLKVYSGDKIGIVGQNGAGKTTLLNILAGEINPDEGNVKRYCNIAYIRQFYQQDISADTKLLKELGVKDKINSEKVSGGEFTRLKIADAFSKNSAVVFADEPTSNLDYKGIELLKQKLYQVETLLLISHDEELLNLVCNKIIEVRDGELSFFEGNFFDYRQQRLA
jgi:macrolide transport system ATP-binding/permease protein